MKRFMREFVWAIVVITFALGAGAQTSAADGKQSDRKGKANTRQVTGEVTAFDLPARTLTVKGKSGIVTLLLTDKTLVRMERQTKQFSDVQVGDRVTVKYRESDGQLAAKSIDIKTTSKKPKSPPS